ncbi:MAG: hypothetical protein HY649_10285 [Acidobacteria bacterium]|nr:hypothetical protein [Acidobacteriota bacterium]
MSDQPKSAVGLDFIEVLFAIVVGIGLERMMDNPWVTDLISNWARIDLWFFVLGNTVVIGSWVGYHKAMSRGLDPEIRTWQGFSRFLIDIILLFEYARLLTSFSNPRMVLYLIFQVFVLYVVWDCIVITEQSQGKHGGATIFWCIFFGLISWMGSKVPWMVNETNSWRILSVFSILGALLYRLEKWWIPPGLDTLYDFLARGQKRLIRHK